MRQAFEIKVDDTFNSVEIHRYHGPCTAFKVSRENLKVFMEELASPSLDVCGVYLLLSDNEDGKQVYVGESEPVCKRLRQHLLRPIFDWDEAIIFIGSGSDSTWEKSNIKYLEHCLHRDLSATASYEVKNRNTPTKSTVAYPWEWDKIAKEIESLVPFLGHPRLFNGSKSRPRTLKNRPVNRNTIGNLRVGQIVQIMFPWLFANGYITENELTYLLSEEARKDFKLRGSNFRVLLESNHRASGYISGSFRYYQHLTLSLNGASYYLSNQFRADGLPALMTWIQSLGVTERTIKKVLAES